MSVQEYLRIINGIPESRELVPNELFTFGFIELIPNESDISYELEGVNIDSGNIILQVRVKDSKDISRVEVTSLSDDISLHCGEYGTPERVLKETIDTLEGIQLRLKKEIHKSKIEVLSQALEAYKQKGKDFNPSTK